MNPKKKKNSGDAAPTHGQPKKRLYFEILKIDFIFLNFNMYSFFFFFLVVVVVVVIVIGIMFHDH